MTHEYPKLRFGLEAFPVEHEGQRLVLVRDRLGYSEESLLISPAVAGLLTQMDGRSSLRDLQAYYTRMTGELLFSEDLNEILGRLDELLFLENDRFIDHVSRTVGRFQQDPIRHMQHAGKSYPTEPDELRKTLEGFFSPERGGPGIPQPGSNNSRVVGLVAPHIDLQAGGPTFAHAYKAAMEALPPDTWVVLGTGHEPVDNYFALTQKEFETPLGLVSCDHAFCEDLLARAPRDLKAGEYNHHREHSVEFQAVFLAFTQPKARIVPLLCSFGQEDWDIDRAYIDQVAEAIRDTARNRNYSVGFLASVDLAHIGPRYGDHFRPHPGTVTQHLQADVDLLHILEKCDAEVFIQRINREQNRRRVCGMAPLYLLARILGGTAEGRILDHRHASVDTENSFVTFASMAFYSPVHSNPG